MKLFLAGIAEHHARITQTPWLHSTGNWKYLLCASLMVLIAGLVNFEVRDLQWEHWKSQPGEYFLDGSPMVSNTDSGYFLSLARDYSQSASIGTFDETRLFPDFLEANRAASDPRFDAYEDRPVGATDIPLYSVMLAHAADLFTEGDLVHAGNLMIPFSMLLTGLAIGLMFWVAGYPAEGAIAAVGAGLSQGFMFRTSIGQVDTDQLMIFFLALCLSFALLASSERNPYRIVGYSLLTALSVSLAYWWHPNGIFIIVIPAVMGIGIYLNTCRLSYAVFALAAFIIAVNPLVFFNALTDFVPQVWSRLTGNIFATQQLPGEGGLVFPHTFTTVAELGRYNIVDMFGFMAPHPVIGAVGTIGFVLWMMVHPKRGVLFLPVFALGLLSVVAGIRFVIFAVPFVWFGMAWVLMSVARYVFRARSQDTEATPPDTYLGVIVVASVLLFGTAAWSYDDRGSRPFFSVPITKSFKALGEFTGRDGGIITTWWDYGYWAHFQSGMDTFHDPATQTSPRTHLLARGLTSPVRDELIQIVKFVTSQGTKGVESNADSLQSLNTAIAGASMPEKPLYIALTHEMGDWMESIAALGRFNIETGQPPSDDIVARYELVRLRCDPVDNSRFQCERGLLNLRAGTIDGKPTVGEIVVVRNGFVEQAAKTNINSPLVLIIQITPDGLHHLGIMHRDNWTSSYNQLFHQGRFDSSRLQMVLDGYPTVRIYKVIR